MVVCSSLKFSWGGGSLFKACLCVLSCVHSFDVLFVLYAACALIWLFHHLNGVDTGIFYLSGSNGTG